MITLLKLGGSLITNKKVERSFREATVKRLAQEIRQALDANPDLKLIIGHGSGSFGHFEATRHDTIHGVYTSADWQGFAQVATIAAELNYLVTKTLSDADIPVFRVQPSASVRTENGIVTDMTLHPIEKALENGLIPLIYGDVAMDDHRGG
ncbi:MAG: isopentenyl phosphate kinase, partial [Aggregatilineales bacterium]